MILKVNKLNYFAAFTAALLLLGCSSIKEANKAKCEIKNIALGQEINREIPPLEDVKKASLEQMVSFAMKARPEIKVAELSVKDARLALKQLAADAPIFQNTNNIFTSFSVDFGVRHAESSKSVQGIDNLEASTHGNASSDISLSLLLWDFGRNNAAVAAQIERVIAAENSLLEVKYSVFEDVAASYFDMLEKRALMQVALTNAHEFAVHLEHAEKRLEAGEIKKLDILRARLDLAVAKEALINASNNVRVTSASMLSALGLESSKYSCDEIFGNFTDSLSEMTRCLPDTNETLEEIFSFARTNAPAVSVKRARLRAAMSDVDAAKAELLPKITASASLNWADPVWLWNWGVNGAWNLFSGFRKRNALKRSVVAMQTIAADVEDAELKLSVSLEHALSRRDNALEARQSANESLQRASENMRYVGAMFDVGEASRVDFTSAVSDYIEALGSRVIAFYEGQRAEAALFALTGRYPRYEEKKIKENDL